MLELVNILSGRESLVDLQDPQARAEPEEEEEEVRKNVKKPIPTRLTLFT